MSKKDKHEDVPTAKVGGVVADIQSTSMNGSVAA